MDSNRTENTRNKKKSKPNLDTKEPAADHPTKEGADVEPDSGDPRTTTTLFISSLSDSVDSAKLLERASSIGPVRDAFVVSDPVKAKSRGFGYVRFVLREDAETALKDGLGEFEGQAKPPLVTWAKPKLNPEERAQKKLEKTKPQAQKRGRSKPDGLEESADSEAKKRKNNPFSQVKKDPFSNRIVVVQGLPIPTEKDGNDSSKAPKTNPEDSEEEAEEARSETGDDPQAHPGKSITSKALYKKAKKLGRLESVKYPVLFPPSPSSASAHLFFNDATSAAIAQKKLHGHIFKGHFLTTALKSRLDATTRLGHAFGGRLIIRNLQFDITEQDLRFLFAPFGPLHSIDIPTTVVEGKPKPRGRGFAFVWMLNEADAGRAIEGLNGKKVYTGIALDAIQKETDNEKKSAKRKREKGNDSVERGRVIAVDWVLSKQKYEEAEGAGDEKTSDDQESNDDDDEEDEDEEDEEDDEEDDDESGSENDDGDDESALDGSYDSDAQIGSSEEEEDATDGKFKAKKEQGTTLFVRNLSFEATEQELHTLFRPFGPLRYARIVMDPKLGRSRGTGFVCLWNKEDAEKVLDLTRKLESEGFGHGPPAANGLPSLLQPDPSSSLASRLSLHGRVLGISEAVSRDQAEKLRIDRDKSGACKDKRRLYLMREGVIFPNSDEAKNLHPADLAARQQSFDQRKALLRSNLSLYISFTRLSIRQLPLYVSERCLKRLARHALDQWRKEVKAGKRAELTQEELEREITLEQKIPEKKSESKKKKEIKSKVKQVKILRTTEKTDGTTGLGKSKGYGFLEMESHADALRVLRWANANPVVDRLLREWTCEEIERSIQQNETAGVEEDDESPKKKRAKNNNQDTDDSSKKQKGKKNDQNADESSKDKKPKPSEPKMDEKRIEKLQIKLNELRSELETLDNRNKKAAAKVSSNHSDGKNQAETAHIKPHRMLIIEFAIENAQTVKKRLERKEKMRERDMKKDGTKNEEDKKATGHDNNDDDNKNRSKQSGKGHSKTAEQKNNSRQRKLRVSSSAPEKDPIESAEKNSQSKLGRIISQKRKSKKIKRGSK
ncbi:RNA recognition motif-containing protein [Puccinia graminis f. sp. tritici]|uniref:RNA recognition motif-containing protein n=1 Tax=Puccinia graminis f. sp. tritici TaxID=56615 RepID=A0A5B0N0R7_PUCGR|nr:RNA recognition motif-containing protein [Puccinia graminis f. sp. tritici]KAA1081788.1 RNA recognition motif-containing protein [Puccinia graminis f. sp. tritici]